MNIIPYDGCAFLIKGWLRSVIADQYFQKLIKELIWQQEKISLFGKKILCPRLTAWYGDAGIHYKYSNVMHIAEGWHPTLLHIKHRLEKEFCISFNSVLCNLYRNGQDYMGWHADNERSLGKHPTIASICLGAERLFLFKHRQTKEKISIMLPNGSLLLMRNELQQHWLHSLPKVQLGQVGQRINLTYRLINN